MRITDAQLEEWRTHGYVVVENFLSAGELAAARAALAAMFPTFEQYAAMPDAYRTSNEGGHQRELPFLGEILNFVALHPDIIDFAERALGTTAITLFQSLVWAKYGGVDQFDQVLHVDHQNMSLVCPDPDGPPEEITFILYYVDVDEDLGATKLVSKQHTREDLLSPYFRPREQYPDLYALEKPVVAPAGSVLIFTNFTFHRGATIRPYGHVRYSHHFMYRPQAAPWNGYSDWGHFGQFPEMQRIIETASPRQREVLGFPPRGHAYWSEASLRRMAARYPDMEMAPYLDEAPLPDDVKERIRSTLADAASKGRAQTARAVQSVNESDDRRLRTLQNAYWEGVADYCGAVTGVPASTWRTWMGLGSR